MSEWGCRRMGNTEMFNFKKIIRNIGAMLTVGVFTLGLPNDGRAADANPPERMTYQGYLVLSLIHI